MIDATYGADPRQVTGFSVSVGGVVMFGTTERVDRMKKRYMDSIPRVDSQRAVLVTESYMKTEAEPMVLRRAKALKKIFEEIGVFIADDELIVGSQTDVYRGASLYPEYGIEWLYDELDTGVFDARTTSSEQYFMDEKDREAVRGIREYWKGKHLYDHMARAMPEGSGKAIDSGVLTFRMEELVPVTPGHCIPNFEKLLKKGFMGIKKDAEGQLRKLGVGMQGTDIEKYHFWKAIVLVCDGAAAFGRRYAALARSMAAAEKDPSRRAELLRIADTCEWVPANPARTFREAIQSVWFLELLFILDLVHPGLSPGRFDQYMYPYYERDIAEGYITKAGAQELVECLWIKMSELGKIKNARVSKSAGGYSSGQNIIIGGQTRDGRDATNDVSFMCLNAHAGLMLHDPPLSIRIWDGTPDDLWDRAVELTKIAGGLPAFQNDEIIITQLMNSGVSLEDARNYAIVGCVEPASPGNSFPCCGGTGAASFLNLPQALLLALNNGVHPLTGKQVGPRTGDLSTFGSFEELKEAYVTQVHHFVDWHVTLTNMCELINRQYMPLPLLSAVMEPCIERGLDVLAGGAKYNSIGTAGVGTGNVADALAAVKKLVFEEGRYTGADLLEAIRTNWEGKEALRNEVMNHAPQYGNDDPYVDELARWSTSVFTARLNGSTGPRGPYRAGLWPVAMHIIMGQHTAATLDGRKKGEPLADGISPRQGTDRNGPTSVLKSASLIDQFGCYNGTLLNMRFHPNAVKGMEGTQKLRGLIQTYFDMKGMEVQVNVMSADTLRDAQKNPDQYRNLVVRVAGYSAFFVELHRDLQEDIISRTEHAA